MTDAAPPAFVLIPGAGGDARYWDELVAELARRGRAAVAVDIPEDDPTLGLPEYAAIVTAVLDAHPRAVLVAQSFGGFTAAMVAEHPSVRAIVLLNAMIPLPGETPGAWWENTGAPAARIEQDLAAGRRPEFDVETHFLHDIPDAVKQPMLAEAPRQPSATPFAQPCLFSGWPPVPLHVLVGADDRFFPAAFQQKVTRDRLGIDAHLVPGGHLAAKSNPTALADRLLALTDPPAG